MAEYLVVSDTEDFKDVRIVEGKHIQEAIEKLKLGNGESVTVYGIAGPVRTVTVKTETVRHVEVE